MMTVPYVARPADQEQLPWLGGGRLRILLDGTGTGGQVALVRSAPPRGAASPVHVHEKDDEIVLLLRGSGLFWSGDQRFELSAGGVAFLPRGLPHTYLFTSDEADMLAVCTPAGMEDFFRTASA